MGHIAQLRKHFKSINTCDFIITLIKREKNPLLSLWELNGSSLNKFESHSPKDALCQVWLKLAKWFRRRRFLNFVNVFSLFRNYLSLLKGRTLHLNKLESPSPNFVPSLDEIGQWFLRRRWKCEKFTDGRTDGRRTSGDQKSSLELLAQVR